MGLSTLQLNEIHLEYEHRRIAMRERQSKRLEKIYQAVPDLPAIRKEKIALLTNIAMSNMKKNQLDSENMKVRLEYLKKLETKLLYERGFSKFDLEIEYVCQDCKDTGYIEDKKCHCYRQLEIRLLYANSNLEHCLEKENFSNFSMEHYKGGQAESLAKRAVDKSKLFIRYLVSKEKREDYINNIFLYGTVGTGKTFLTHCIAKELLDNGVVVLYFSAIRLFEIMAKLTFSYEKEDKYAWDDIYETDVLIIDDLGTEMVNDFVKSTLFSCLNERIIRNKHTIISTNLSINDIADLYSKRVFSRIIGNYELLKLEGEDIRLRKRYQFNN